jgi:ATP-dependent Clp protease adaptor protein ClpS
VGSDAAPPAAPCNEGAQICRFRHAFGGDNLAQGPQGSRQTGAESRGFLMNDIVVKPKTNVKTKVKTKTERPRLHKVILVNDDYTPREFVVTVLKAEFRMTEDQAYKVMITAHRLGVCVVAVFTKDVAETKATRATDAGRAKGYPLLFTTEPEE